MATTLDKTLTTSLRTALAGTPMRFATVVKGMSGKLLTAKAIAPKEIAQARKEVGGNDVYQGRCVGENGTLFFEVAKEPPPTLAAQLKRRIKEDAGITCPVEIRVRADAEGEPVVEGAAPPRTATPPPAGPEPAAPARPTDDGLDPLFTQCRTAYEQVRKTLRAEVEKLKQQIVATFTLDAGYDPSQVVAATAALDDLPDGLDERLLDTLAAALKSSDPSERRVLRAAAADLVDEYLQFLEGDALFALLDENGFTSAAPRKAASAVLTALAAKL